MKFYYFLASLVLARNDPCAFSVIERKFGESCDKGKCNFSYNQFIIVFNS